MQNKTSEQNLSSQSLHNVAGELESESSMTSVAGEKMRGVQAAARQQQALAMGLIKAGELAYICRPLAYVIALRM